MVAPLRKRPRPSCTWHRPFLAMLPKILAHFRVAFRGLSPEARAEATQEAVANAWVAFVRLVRTGPSGAGLSHRLGEVRRLPIPRWDDEWASGKTAAMCCPSVPSA